MKTVGLLRPSDPEDARTLHRSVAPAARTVVVEAARTMPVDDSRFQELVTDEVHAVANRALFASLLEVHDGSREEFERWLEGLDGDPEVTTFGTETVDGIVWHRFRDRVVAATYQHEPEAARGTLRRFAYNELYRDVIEG